MFTEKWMNAFKKNWNKKEDITKPLGEIKFSQTIGYGIKGEEKPKAVLIVKEGKADKAKLYEGEELNWDLRCTKDNWKYYFKNPFSISSLGRAYLAGWIQFKVGDYFSMIKNPSMIGPFLNSFKVMGETDKEFED